MSVWNHRDGQKTIARDFGNGGSYATPKGRGFLAHSVASLVGYDTKTKTGSHCILQGMDRGYIARDAKIYGIESNAAFHDGIQAHADSIGMDMTLHRGNLKTFIPPRKLGLLSLDLMCTPHLWIGETFLANIYAMMLSRRTAVCFNLNIQHKSPDLAAIMAIYHADKEYYDSKFHEYTQRGRIDPTRPIDPARPFTGVIETGFYAMAAFVSVEHYMRQTTFGYLGCYRYFERSSPTAGVQRMITLRYERK